MGWIRTQYRDGFLFFVIGSCLIAAFAPWLSGPFWFDAVLNFLGSYLILTLWVIVRVLWATAFKKKNQNSG